MTVVEVFKDLSKHAILGVMIHEQMADYYSFLNLKGYSKAHEYHMFKELKSMRRLHRYFIEHCNMLIEESQIESPDVIPTSWYRYTRQDVDVSNKRQAVKTGLEKWADWERETKDLYERMYKALFSEGDIAGSMIIKDMIKDVDSELVEAEGKCMELSNADYSMTYILSEQEPLYKWYIEKLK